jgi:putative flippase GtrA
MGLADIRQAISRCGAKKLAGRGVRQFLLFLVSGGIAAFLNWSSRFIFSHWMPFELAVVAAFFVGLTVGFVMMRLYVFDAAPKAVIHQASIYIFVNMLALVQTLIISVVLARWILPAWGIVNYAEASAHLAGVLVPVATSYFGHKFFTFR